MALQKKVMLMRPLVSWFAGLFLGEVITVHNYCPTAPQQ